MKKGKTTKPRNIPSVKNNFNDTTSKLSKPEINTNSNQAYKIALKVMPIVDAKTVKYTDNLFKHSESKITNEDIELKKEASLNNPQDVLKQEEDWKKARLQLEIEIINLRKALEDERKNLIDKLQQKSGEAQKLVEEKIEAIQKSKQDDINSEKLKIFENVITSFLEPIMLFEKTIESTNLNPAIANYLQGFNMIVGMFKDSLNNLGLQQIEVLVGDTFNENYMVAFDTVIDANFKTNKVVKIIDKGFVFQNRVIKYVSVIVAK